MQKVALEDRVLPKDGLHLDFPRLLGYEELGEFVDQWAIRLNGEIYSEFDRRDKVDSRLAREGKKKSREVLSAGLKGKLVVKQNYYSLNFELCRRYPSTKPSQFDSLKLYFPSDCVPSSSSQENLANANEAMVKAMEYFGKQP